jgi:hypothetical protein
MRHWKSIFLVVGLLAACSQSPQGVTPQVVVTPEPSVAVEKTAVPKFKRVYHWTIQKEVTDPASQPLTLSAGQSYTVKYKISLVGTPKDQDFQVEGTVVIKNTGAGAVVLQAPTDTLSTGENVALSCGVSFPYTLPEGGSLSCTYSQALPNGQSRTNTASVSWSAGDKSGTASGQASFSFTTPTEVVDGSVTVADPSATLVSAISSINLEGVISQAYFFERTVRFDACGDHEVQNTATFTTNTTGTQGSASASLQVRVPCAGGCTLTQGYWKTHSRYGPAPYDDTWALIGEDTAFYLSGQTYYQVLWTPPAGGNAYYILAHQFIAARLNKLNGASTTSAVDTAMNWAHTFFSTYTPGNVPKAQASLAKAYAATLDSYNNGLIGPGHCSE